MKKLLSLAVLGLVLLSSCVKGFDGMEPEPTPTPDPSSNTELSDEEMKKYAEELLGFTIPENQDWCTTVTGKVTFNVNSSVKKVVIMALVGLTDEDGEAYNTMKVLNQAETNSQSSVVLNYDAPAKNEGLYAAFYTDTDCMYKKIEGNSVSFDQTPAKTRGLTRTVSAPTGTFSIGKIENSYAAERGWIPDEKLYMLADDDYALMKIPAEPYSTLYTNILRELVFSYLPNGKTFNNLVQVKAAGYTDDNAYRVTTGGEGPIIISPIYKQDGADKYGNEVYNSDFYYYYFNPENLPNTTEEQVAFLQNLPKYKLIPFNQHFGEKEDDVVDKRTSFAALYFGDEKTPAIGKEGSFIFPAGYKIGFMVRAKTEHIENGKPRKQGELYFDGRLNVDINGYSETNFKSSFKDKKLPLNSPRATWLNINGHELMCWESGTDTDFNDIILEVEGSVVPIHTSHDFEFNTYTFCFEDRKKGDYDLNDVVIKAKRIDATTVEYSIVACGAYDELYIKNIGKDNDEVHSLFGKSRSTFINTESKNCDPIIVTKTIDDTFSFLNESDMPYIVNKTENNTVKVATLGKDPHAILVPFDFKYPRERVCVKDAYSKFNNWGKKAVHEDNWYTLPVAGKVFE